MSAAYWVCAMITFARALTSFAFSVVAVSAGSGQTRTNALYAASRSAGLLVASTVPLFYQSTPWLSAVAVVMILVQLADAAIGITIHDYVKTYGPAATAILNLMALVWVLM